MIDCNECQIWIEKLIDEDVDIPYEIDEHIHQCPSCQRYRTSMELVAGTLTHLAVEPAPDTLVDDVMQYIDQREDQLAGSPLNATVKPIVQFWNDIIAYLSSLKLNRVFYREAWPTAIATLAVVWGVLVAPQVEAGKADEIREAFGTKVISLTDRTLDEVEKYAERVKSYASDWIESSSETIQPDKETEDADNVGMKYFIPDNRNLFQDTAKTT